MPSESGTRTGHVVHPTLNGIWPTRGPAATSNVPTFVGPYIPCPLRSSWQAPAQWQPQACPSSLRVVIVSLQYCRLVCN
eukprot:6946675-Prymnesium_polylepis.1